MRKRGHRVLNLPHNFGGQECICIKALHRTYALGHRSGGAAQIYSPGAALFVCYYCGRHFGGVLHLLDGRHEVLGDAHLHQCLPRWRRTAIDMGLGLLRRS